MSSLSLEERKRKLAEARAAREAKDKQVVELGEQLAKMQSTTTNQSAQSVGSSSQALSAPSEAYSAHSQPSQTVTNTTITPVTHISRETKVAVVDVPPTPQPSVETYSKTINTDPVFIYAEERPSPTKKDEEKMNSESETELLRKTLVDETFGSRIVMNTVWDATALAPRLLKTQHFLNFIDVASAVMESSTKAADGATDGSSSAAAVFSSLGSRSKSQGVLARRGGSFITDTMARDPRVVVALAFQPGSSDTFAVSYGTGEVPGSTLAGRQHDAVALWSVRKGIPVMITFKYEIHSLCFVPSQPHILLGGSAKGHVVMWDVRNSATPTAITFPSLNSHNMPITHMRVVGDASRSSLVSISLDGRVCLWSINDLRHPVASMVICSAHSDTARMSLTSASTPWTRERRPGGDVETSHLYFGSTKGTLHVATRNVVDRRIIASQISSFAHDGTVNSVDTHPGDTSEVDSPISNLILTASSDWSCRIWLGDASFKLNHSDIVLDARWSPTHPSVFASCDASGAVSLWNVLHSTQAPLAQITLEDSSAPGGRGPVMLHRLAWSSSGGCIVVGGNQGECYSLAVNLPESTEKDSEALSKWIARNLAGEIS